MTTYTIKPLAWRQSVGRNRWHADTVLGIMMADKASDGAWFWAHFFDNDVDEAEEICVSRKDAIEKAEAFYLEQIKQALVPV